MIRSKKSVSNLWRPSPDTSKRRNVYRFDKNERTTLFTKGQFEKIMSNIHPYDLVAYGELEPFYEELCRWLNLNRGSILLSSGSDAAIKSIFETYVEKEDEVLISLPNYAMFAAYTEMFGAKQVQHLYKEDLTIGVDSLIQKINKKTKLIIISNPGHTGSIVPESDLLKVLKAAQSYDAILLIDEAYHHFYPKSMLGHIDKFENLIITRTFSKAFGLASIRIGLVLSCKRIDEVYKVKLVHEITGLAAKIGFNILKNLDILDDYVEEVNKGKEILYAKLPDFGIEVLRSEANFVFFRFKRKINKKDFKDFMLDKKIIISGPFCNTPFNNHLRITVGDEKQMNHFIDILNQFCNSN